jgi:hypothetical protein
MASIVRIKRSEVSGNPSTLGQGELAYSALPDNGVNGGDRLYVGMGTETAGNAVNHVVVGGKFFTDLLDHNAGVLTASSALIADSDSKLDNIKVDNIDIDGNTISSTDTNGNINVTPNGTGKSVISNLYTDATTSLTEFIQDVTGGQIVDSTEIAATYDDGAGTTSLALKTTGVTAGSYGSTTSVPVITFDSKGRATSATVASISTTLNVAGNAGTDGIDLATDTLNITGSAPISTSVNASTNTILISASDASTSAKGVASFNAASFSASSGDVSIKSGGVTNLQLVNSSTTIGTTTVALGASSTTLAGLTSVASTDFTGALTGNATTATTLETARTVAITGPITGTATSFNGSANISIPVTALDVSHVNVTGTLAVNHGGTGVTTSTGTGSVVLSDSAALTGTPTAPTAAIGTTTTQLATTQFVTLAVDAARTGLDVKASVNAATTANITLSNTQTIDGVALSVGDRVLVKDQSTGSENGIYVVASGAWARSADADNDAEVTSGMFTFVEQGTYNADSGWVLSTDGTIVVGTTDLVFVQFSGAGQIIAGLGLTKTGNTLDVGAGTGIAVNADDVALTGQALAFHNLATNGIVARTASGAVAARTVTGTANRTSVTNGDGVSGNPTLDIASTYVGQTSITTLGTVTTGTWNATTIGVPNGGTGLTTATSRGIIYGNGASALGVTAGSTITGSFLREDATGVPFWSNSIDGGTY